jgi:catechol 2,3-dioxygenase-like lactoylglutathione lyase family enzyme
MTLPAGSTPLGFILTADRARALAFYHGTMGFALVSQDAYGATLDMAGLTVRLTDSPGHIGGPHGVLGWTVPDIEAAVTALGAQGVSFAIYPGFGQDARGIWTDPGRKVRQAWFADPDGNVLSLKQDT